ncbi:glycosyltransferase [Oscillatoria sp. CS-180]|uniref:glycosyltransferase n=1 Tax=Oscillatoria sp. CS-180 TaxID=3021720 RepID=UPI00232D1565|nr:glycosyltransferase [Oscillatoria sp. CS-180]MDB9527392.1 glycosyltransferase [Oscillatoria sp. CS-180]
MKIAYITIKNAQRLGKGMEWSGTGFYIAQALKNQSLPVDYFGPLQDRLPMRLVRKAKRHYYHQFFRKLYLKDTEPVILKGYADQVNQKLSTGRYDVVMSATVNPIAYLETDIPMLFWADATFQNTANFYPKYSNLCEETIANGHKMERLGIQKARFAIYSSHWAARTAIDFYGADPQKVKVVPFGANLESNLTLPEVKNLIDARPSTLCKMVFIGVEWLRKGGDKALAIAKALNDAGLPTELTLVGCQPESESPLPNFVKPLGYISKLSDSGRERISRLIAESHFLILPTLADCSPIVFCEANAFGVPCLSTNVGGIPTIINEASNNGKLFDVDADEAKYCDYVVNLFANYSAYKDTALSSFNTYKSRLNWQAAGNSIKNLLVEATA